MGCFSTCFGTCKRSRRRRRRAVNRNSSLLHHLQTYESVDGFQVPQLIEEEEEQQQQQEKDENQIEFTPHSNEEKIEKANSSERKKVTFDLNVKIYEHFRPEEEEENTNFEGNDMEERLEKEAENKEEKSGCSSQCGSDCSSSSLFSFPTDHRYRDCRDSDDEFDDLLSSDESEIDDEDNYYSDEEVESEVVEEKCQQQSSESLFSLSLDSRKHGFGVELGEKEVNSPLPMKNSSEKESNSGENTRKYVDSVLNPVENLSQWKCVKARSKQASKDQYSEVSKENVVVSAGQDFCIPVKKNPVFEAEIGVDTSLSSWLMCSEGKNPKDNSRSSSVSVGNSPSDRRKISPNKFEDRPILGALTLEELRQYSATSSPRKSPSKSPEDRPIIGTVGSYWSHTADSGSSTKSTRSRFRESAEVVWDATPFETRLEKALEKEGSVEHVLAV